MKNEVPSAAVAATMGKGKLLGLIVEKQEHSGKLELEKVESGAAVKAITDALGLLPAPKPEHANGVPLAGADFAPVVAAGAEVVPAAAPPPQRRLRYNQDTGELEKVDA